MIAKKTNFSEPKMNLLLFFVKFASKKVMNLEKRELRDNIDGKKYNQSIFLFCFTYIPPSLLLNFSAMREKKSITIEIFVHFLFFFC